MEIKVLAKNTAILASPKILKFIVGILKSKFIAMILGTTGVGLTNQLLSIINMIRQSTLSFLPDGMVKLIAQENAINYDINKIAQIIKTYFFMVIPIAVLTTILGYFFASELTIYIFGDIKYKRFFLIGFTAIPVSIVGASMRAFLKAFKEIKSFAVAEIIIILINLIIFFPLIFYLQILGGIIYVTLTFFVSFFVIFYLVKKNVFNKYNISFNNIRYAVLSKKYFKELLTFISVGVIAGVFRVFENISTRAIVVNNLSIDKIGIYSPITKWEGLFLGFILPSVYTYLFPRLSEAKNNKEIIGVINDVIRLITFLTLPFILLAISTREWIIPLFYSKEFIEASLYLPFHFSFLLFAVWSTIFEQIFAPTGRLKSFLVFIIIINSISLLLVYFFVPKFGLYGYLLKFTITPLMFIIIFFTYWRYEIGLKINAENVYLIIYSIFCSFILVVLKDVNNYLQLITAIALVIFLFFLLRKNEKKFLLRKITSLKNSN